MHFEGEADLKFIRDNIYVGGYGIRSDIETYNWMEDNFDIKITKVHMTSEKNYHLDCQFSPITTECALVCTEIMDQKDIKAVEKLVDIVDIPKKEAEAMAANIVRVGSNILVCSSIAEMKESDDSYEIESNKITRLNKACIKNGLGLVVFNLSSFDVSGAALSCNVAHLNFVDYQSPNAEVF
jgi:N-dimethylarginine dimethylaminohydrolase